MIKYSFKDIIIHGIGGRIKRTYFRIYELFFPKLKINEELLKKIIKDYDLERLTLKLKDKYNNLSLKEGDNAEYFNNILTYNFTDKYLPNNYFFLYPPNVAVIDFLVKNINKESIIIDYGFGLGNLEIYLKEIGFKNVLCYDNYSQISKETIISYLRDFKAENIILSKDQCLKLKNKVAICICYFWSKLEREIIEKEINNQELEYILLDYHYAPRRIKNFKIAGIYDNLLIVFKRNEKN